MHLVYIYGPPGVGKLTVGRALVELTGYRLFHNHLMVDLAASLFARETPEYFDYIRVIRGAGFEAAARNGVSLVATGVYRGTEVQNEAMRWMLGPVLEHGGRPLFVQLTCEREEWLRRVQSASRAALNKITDPAFAVSFLEQHNLHATMPFEPHLAIDTSGREPDDVAREIVRRLDS
ncbi:MAG: AAA family ATPase [Chloroflexi bacterium]|nr:AAA family ATPase [Chloroflexota bacterium]